MSRGVECYGRLVWGSIDFCFLTFNQILWSLLRKANGDSLLSEHKNSQAVLWALLNLKIDSVLRKETEENDRRLG
eukprot:IDg8863t1